MFFNLYFHALLYNHVFHETFFKCFFLSLPVLHSYFAMPIKESQFIRGVQGKAQHPWQHTGSGPQLSLSLLIQFSQSGQHPSLNLALPSLGNRFTTAAPVDVLSLPLPLPPESLEGTEVVPELDSHPILPPPHPERVPHHPGSTACRL